MFTKKINQPELHKHLKTGKPIFILDHDDSDKLDFKHYVDVLELTIQQANTPFVVGVTGAWGSGKTQLVNTFLKKRLVDKYKNQYGFVYFDAWKYQNDSFRREFLNVADDNLKTGIDLKKIYEGHESEQPTTRYDLRLEPYINIAVVGAIFCIVTVATSIFNWNTITITPLGFFLSLFWPFIKGRFFSLDGGLDPSKSELIKSLEDRVITNPLFSIEQFETLFKKIIQKAISNGNKKVVIIIDNIDRCDSDTVVELLSTIKTYLNVNGCIYIIPVDEDALVQHINNGYSIVEKDSSRLHQRAKDYLRKLFNMNIYLNPILPDNKELYISNLISNDLSFQISDQEREKVTLMIMTAYSHTPRKIKQFLNNLTSQYLLLKSRYIENKIEINPDISISFAAKLLIIRDEWPSFYNKIIVDPDFFAEMQNIIEDPLHPARNSERVKVVLDDGDGLSHFLVSTAYITEDRTEQQISLKKAHIKMEGSKLIESFITNNSESAKTLLSSMVDKESASAALITEMNTRVSRGNFVAGVNICSVILEVFDNFDDTQKKKLSDQFAYMMSLSATINQTSTLALSKVFDLISFATNPRTGNCAKVTSHISKALRDSSGISIELIRSVFVKHKNILTDSSKNDIRVAVETSYPSDQTDRLKDMLLEEINDQEKFNLLISNKTLDLMYFDIQKIRLENVTENTSLVRLVSGISQFLSQDKTTDMLNILDPEIHRDNSWGIDKETFLDLFVKLIEDTTYEEFDSDMVDKCITIITNQDIPILLKNKISRIINKITNQNDDLQQKITKAYAGYLSLRSDPSGAVKGLVESIISNNIIFIQPIITDLQKMTTHSGVNTAQERSIIWDLIDKLCIFLNISPVPYYVDTLDSTTDLHIFKDCVGRIVAIKSKIKKGEINGLIDTTLAKLPTFSTDQKIEALDTLTPLLYLINHEEKDSLSAQLLLIIEDEGVNVNTRRSAMNLLVDENLVKTMEYKKSKNKCIIRIISVVKNIDFSEKFHYLDYLINKVFGPLSKNDKDELSAYIKTFRDFSVGTAEEQFYTRYKDSMAK